MVPIPAKHQVFQNHVTLKITSDLGFGVPILCTFEIFGVNLQLHYLWSLEFSSRESIRRFARIA